MTKKFDGFVIKELENAKKLNDYVKEEAPLFAIQFDNDLRHDAALPKILSYKLRFKDDNEWLINELYNTVVLSKKPRPDDQPPHYECFLTAQNAIDKAFIMAVTGKNASHPKLHLKVSFKNKIDPFLC